MKITHSHPSTINRKRAEESLNRETELEEIRLRGGTLKGEKTESSRDTYMLRLMASEGLSPDVVNRSIL
jgi:hypothetical protein